jgi:3D (Asp-Asp-Asp) domain-containing protein
MICGLLMLLATTQTQTRVMITTGYCPCSRCCSRETGITASGVPAVGRLVAAPRSIPFGTWLRVPGYGLAPVRDRGRAIVGNRLDLYFDGPNAHQRALQWGVKRLRVEVLR